MIDEKKVTELVENRIAGTALFLVDVKIGKANEIHVLVDSFAGVDIDECGDISKWLAAELDKMEENYSLEVSSPGIGSPFKVSKQYEKSVGRDVEVLLKDGRKIKGQLKKAEQDSITLEVLETLDSGGKKKKKEAITKVLAFDDIKSTKEVITF